MLRLSVMLQRPLPIGDGISAFAVCAGMCSGATIATKNALTASAEKWKKVDCLKVITVAAIGYILRIIARAKGAISSTHNCLIVWS